ncbi:MAG: hypothetical protein ACOYI9_13770 [Candidatus Hydrogenedentales bacterium]
MGEVKTVELPRLNKVGDHWEITNEEELSDLNTYSDYSYILANDIDDIELTKAWTAPTNFSGNLVGNGKTITTSAAYMEDGFITELSGSVSDLTIKLTGETAFAGGVIKKLSGTLVGLTLDGDGARIVTVADDNGVMVDEVTGSGIMSNCEITANITVSATGDSGGCMAGTLANSGVVSAHGDGNSCLAAGHSHATGDSLVGNLKAAPVLVSAQFVSKKGHNESTDRVFGDWAKDIRVAGDIEMTFEFDKAMDTTAGIEITAGVTPLLAGEGDANWSYVWSDENTVLTLTIKKDALDYATDYAVQLTNANKDTLDNALVALTWNFTTIGGLPVISAPKAYNVTGDEATIFFAYDMGADVPEIASLTVSYRVKGSEAGFTMKELEEGSDKDYIKTDGSTCFVVLDNLAADTEYEVYVAAKNDAGITYDKLYLTGSPLGNTVTTFKTKAMSGNGSSAAPFQIKDADGFNQIGKEVGGNVEYPLDAWYVLMDNIEDGTGFNTITSDFTGNFNGNGFKIGDTTALATRLFSKIDADGQVYDLTLNVNIDSDAAKVAAVAIDNEGVIRNVTVNGTITASANNAQVAAVAHTNSGTVDGCVNNATLSAPNGDEAVGAGIVYSNTSHDTVKYCTNNGKIIAQRIGGIAYENTGAVSNCENSGELDGQYVAGVVFKNDAAGVVSASKNTGKLTSRGELSETYNSGCIVGNGSGSLSGCTCGDDTHGHGDGSGSTVPVTVAGNRLPKPELNTSEGNAPSVPSSTPTDWTSYQTGAMISGTDNSYAVGGTIPFYQNHPKDGDPVNANLWVVKFTLEKFVSSSAKVSLDDGDNWVAAETGNRNLIPVGADGFYLIGTGTTAITVKVDNNGIIENDTADQLTVTFTPSGASLAQLAFGETVGNKVTDAWASLTKTTATVSKTDDTVTIAGTVPFYDTELTITDDNESTLTAHNIWAFSLNLVDYSTNAEIDSATNCVAKIENGHLYVAGTAAQIFGDGDIKVKVKNNITGHGDIELTIKKGEELAVDKIILGSAAAVLPEAGWTSTEVYSATKDNDTNNIILSGTIPFYQEKPAYGTEANQNYYAIKMPLTNLNPSAKYKLDDGNWTSLTEANAPVYYEANSAGKGTLYYVGDSISNEITLVIDNDGKESTTYDQTTITIKFEDAVLGVAIASSGVTTQDLTGVKLGEPEVNVSAENAGLITSLAQTTATEYDLTLAGLIPYYSGNSLTNTNSNDWAVKVTLTNNSGATTSVTAGSASVSEVTDDSFYIYGTYEALDANNIVVTVKNSETNQVTISIKKGSNGIVAESGVPATELVGPTEVIINGVAVLAGNSGVTATVSKTGAGAYDITVSGQVPYYEHNGPAGTHNDWVLELTLANVDGYDSANVSSSDIGTDIKDGKFYIYGKEGFDDTPTLTIIKDSKLILIITIGREGLGGQPGPPPEDPSVER